MSRRRQNPAPAAAPSALTASDWSTGYCLLIFIVTVCAYLPAFSGGFIWDDSGHVTRTDLQSLGGLYRIWFEIGATQQYYPLLHSAFWLEHLAWGESPLGYHMLNVVLHAATAGLFGLLLSRLAVPGAKLAAMLFALHPVCVESVAWIAEQKNTLSAVLYLASALAYLNFDQTRRGKHYAWATGFFILALLTKTVTASLPAALLVIFWWQRGRLTWRRDAMPLLPWFILGTATGLFTAHFERTLIGAQGTEFTFTLVERSLLAGRIFWFYLGHLAWPLDLMFVYPRWTVDSAVWTQWVFSAGAIALLLGLIKAQHHSRGPLAAVLLFTGTLFPVLGFVNVYPFIFSFVADHFQYLASLAIFAAVAAALTTWCARLPRWGGFTIQVTLLCALGALTWAQCGIYHDSETLYRATLDKNPACWMAHNNLAITLADSGRVEEAIGHLKFALKLRPDYPQALNNLGDDLTRLGRAHEALPYLEHALVLQPKYLEAHENLGNALLTETRMAEAITQYEQALVINPQYPEGERNLGLGLAAAGRTNEAISHFEKAVRLKPDFPEAELNWATALTLTNRFPEAMSHFGRAIALDPESAEIRSAYGRALVQAGRYPDAILQYEEAVRLDPENAESQMNLALGLRQAGRLKEAADHYQQAVRLNPDLARQK